MRAWLERPLLSVTEIDRRSAAVAALVEHTVAREELILALQGISDMERLVGRIVYGTAGGRDLASLRAAMEKLPLVKAQLSCFEKGRLHQLDEALDDLNDLAALIGQTLVDEPPFSGTASTARWIACAPSSTAARVSSSAWRPPKRKKPASAP